MGFWVRRDGVLVGKVIAATRAEALGIAEGLYRCGWWSSQITVEPRI